MKKNNLYIANDEIDLRELIKTLCREKILILSISIICGLIGYIYAFFVLGQLKTEIKIKNPPFQLFEPYNYLLINKNSSNNNNDYNNNKNNNNKNNNNNNNEDTTRQFISDFKLNFLSLDNVESFVEESRDLDSFKEYLKSKKTSAKKYFHTKLGQSKENENTIIPNTYFLVFEKKVLDGNTFLNNYLEYVKKKNIIETKKNLKLTIENRIQESKDALETAKLINLENPILKSQNQNQVINEPEALFYKGTKVLSQNIIIYQKLLQKLENDQFNYNLILDKGIPPEIITMPSYFFFSIGLVIGFFLSCIILIFKSDLKNK
jgi:LPS O-antigen subunit length determinant protein (WzzB/FepE family)